MNQFNDNTKVGSTLVKDRSGNWTSYEYLAVCFREPPEWSEATIYFNRYCVPGRIDTYGFDYSPAKSGVMERISYHSETKVPLDKALKMFQKDLDKPRVVQMIADACRKPKNSRYVYSLCTKMLSVVAPNSKTYKAVLKIMQERIAEARKSDEAKHDQPVAVI